MRTRWWVLCLVALTVGCDDDTLFGVQVVCVANQPIVSCGGEIEGTWGAVASCADGEIERAIPECPELADARIDLGIVGSIHFDGAALSSDMSTRIREEIQVPSSCVETRPCLEWAPVLSAEYCVDEGHTDEGDDGHIEDDRQRGCICVRNMRTELLMGSKYTTERGALNLDDASANYCVDDEILTIDRLVASGEEEPLLIRMRFRKLEHEE